MPEENLPFLKKLQENNFENTFRDESFFYHDKLFQIIILLCQGTDVSNIAIAKLKKIFKLPYFLDLLLEQDSFGKFTDESIEKTPFPEKSLLESPTIKSHKTEGINLQGITFLKPRLIELIIQIYFKNPIKMNIYDGNSKKIEVFIDKEIRRLENMNFKMNENIKYYDYFFGSFLSFVVYFYNSLENKDYFEGENFDDNNIFKYLAFTIRTIKNNFRNKLNEGQIINLKKLFEISHTYEVNEEKFYRTDIFHAQGSGEFGEQIKTTEEYDFIVKEIEQEKDEVVEDMMLTSKMKMSGAIKKTRVITQVNILSKNAHFWRIFKHQFVVSKVLLEV